MRVEPFRFGHIRHGVLQCVAGEEEAQIFDIKQCRIVAVDLSVAQMNVEPSDMELEMILVGEGRQNER